MPRPLATYRMIMEGVRFESNGSSSSVATAVFFHEIWGFSVFSGILGFFLKIWVFLTLVKF